MTTGKKASIVVVVALVGGLALAVPALISAFSRPDVVVGGKNFTEQQIIGEMMAILIEENTDLSVGRKLNLGGTMICFEGVKSGDLDTYCEYVGTGLMSILGRPVINDPDEAYKVVQDAFAEEWEVAWLQPLGFNNAYTITMRREQASSLGIETISDLAEYVSNNTDGDRLVAGFDSEFLVREDGYPGLTKAYDFEFDADPKHMDTGLMYKACADGEVDVICAFNTDGRVAAYDLKVLEDDKQFFPPYHAAPIFRRETLDTHPQLRALINKLGGRIDDETMRQLNYKVDREDDPMDAAQVAREFLRSEGLIPADEGKD